MPLATAQPSRRLAMTLAVALWLAAGMLCWALLATPAHGDNSGLMKLTESYGSLERVALWQRTLAWLPGGGADEAVALWPKPAIAWTVRLAMTAMFALQALAFAAVWRGRDDHPWRWLAGPIGAQVIMLAMVPSNADVFFYAISGDIANHGSNPYTTHLYAVFDHPLYPYNHWIDMATVYGPIWTLIDRGVMVVGGGNPAEAVLGFKIAVGATAIGLAAATYGVARMLNVGPGRATAAMVLVGWQPTMMIESAGQAHNDVVMIGLALAGVTIVLAGNTGAIRGGIVLVTLSALVKYITLPLLGLLALARLHDRKHAGAAWRIPLALLLDGLAVMAVAIAAFAPYWTGPSILTEMVSEPGRLYTNPLWHIPASGLRAFGEDAAETFERFTRVLAQFLAVVAIAVVLVRFGRVAWRTSAREPSTGSPVWTRPLLTGWAAIFAILAFVPVNTHAWYWSWPVVPIALLVAWDGSDDDRRWPAARWFLPYLVLTALLTLVYHTRIVHPG